MPAARKDTRPHRPPPAPPPSSEQKQQIAVTAALIATTDAMSAFATLCDNAAEALDWFLLELKREHDE
jgi:hypothetical protein